MNDWLSAVILFEIKITTFSTKENRILLTNLLARNGSCNFLKRIRAIFTSGELVEMQFSLSWLALVFALASSAVNGRAFYAWWFLYSMSHSKSVRFKLLLVPQVRPNARRNGTRPSKRTRAHAISSLLRKRAPGTRRPTSAKRAERLSYCSPKNRRRCVRLLRLQLPLNPTCRLVLPMQTATAHHVLVPVGLRARAHLRQLQLAHRPRLQRRHSLLPLDRQRISALRPRATVPAAIHVRVYSYVMTHLCSILFELQINVPICRNWDISQPVLQQLMRCTSIRNGLSRTVLCDGTRASFICKRGGV